MKDHEKVEDLNCHQIEMLDFQLVVVVVVDTVVEAIGVHNVELVFGIVFGFRILFVIECF